LNKEAASILLQLQLEIHCKLM